MARQTALFAALLVLAAVGLALAPYLIFFKAPVLPELGYIQKIFFFHVPAAWGMLLGTLVCAVGGVAYLARRSPWGDALVASAAEVTVLFGLVVLTTGPLWARKAWGHYWVWDVRLTTVLVLFLLFIGVLMARRFGGTAGAKLAAGLALFGAVDAPLIYISVKLWRTVHPQTSAVRTLHPDMRPAFFISLALFTALAIALLWLRYNLERSRHRLDAVAVELARRDS